MTAAYRSYQPPISQMSASTGFCVRSLDATHPPRPRLLLLLRHDTTRLCLRKRKTYVPTTEMRFDNQRRQPNEEKAKDETRHDITTVRTVLSFGNSVIHRYGQSDECIGWNRRRRHRLFSKKKGRKRQNDDDGMDGTYYP